MVKVSSFDIADYLKTEDDIRGFLTEVAETGNASDFVHALGIAARTQGMAKLATEIGVTRTSLYKSLAQDGHPRFETIFKITRALGCKLAVV